MSQTGTTIDNLERHATSEGEVASAIKRAMESVAPDSCGSAARRRAHRVDNNYEGVIEYAGEI